VSENHRWPFSGNQRAQHRPIRAVDEHLVAVGLASQQVPRKRIWIALDPGDGGSHRIRPCYPHGGEDATPNETDTHLCTPAPAHRPTLRQQLTTPRAEASGVRRPHTAPYRGNPDRTEEIRIRTQFGATVDLDETYAWGFQELARLEDEMRTVSDKIVGVPPTRRSPPWTPT
jgi:hypothetical protein